MIQLRPTVESVRPHLEAVLATPSLPARAALSGRQLLERLTSPIRIAILGHPGSGKSQLLNLIAGERMKRAWEEGDVEVAPMMVGQSIGLIHDIVTCKELLDRMVKEAQDQIAKVAKLF